VPKQALPKQALPRQAIALVAALVVFAAIVLSIAGWAAISGNAGSQRGLVIHSEIPTDVTVRLEDGQSAFLGPNGDREHAFVVRREDYPSTISVFDAAGELLFEREFEYSYFADAEFRISIDRNGFYPTTELRDTPVPAP
jgi:hypothetical protein